MHKLVSSQTAQAADRDAEVSFGYPPELLMEEAGIRLQDKLEGLAADGGWDAGNAVYLTGPGNNGGDAWVMARQAYLRGLTSVAVVAVLPPSSENCRLQARRAGQIGIPVLIWPSPEAEIRLRQASVWVDGLWGTGLLGPLRSDRAALVACLESLRAETGKPVAALDVPSGLWEGRVAGEPVLEAHWTLTPGPRKAYCYFPGHRSLCGRILEVPLAFPRAADAVSQLLDTQDLGRLLPPVGPHDHKGARGHVALAGGAPGMTGALVLAARSAAATGAGLVSLGVDEDLLGVVAPQVPAFQVRAGDTLAGLAARYDALAVGPGWGRTADRPGLLAALWNTALPLVVDADGLAAWTALGRPSREAPTVFTPHPGEFLRLGAGEVPSVAAAAALAAEKTVVVVLKGSATWIVAPDGRKAVWDGAEPALGTGGSGDCLAGVVAALLAAGLGAFEAAQAGVVLHGTAGKELALREGWFTADRLPEALARVSSACRTSAGRL